MSATATSLPPELLLNIFEHTRPDAHRSLDWVPAGCTSMAAYALVCRAWAAVAQRALFRISIPHADATLFLATVRVLTSVRSTLPDAVDKLVLSLGNKDDTQTIAEVVALCPNLRHFSILVQWHTVSTFAAFTDAQLELLARAQRITHLSARIFSVQVAIVPQLIRAWPRIAYLDLRGTAGTPPTVPLCLRELRLHTTHSFPVHDSAVPLETLVIDGLRIPLSDFAPVLARIRRLHILVPYDTTMLAASLPLLAQMSALRELIMSADDLTTVMLDAFPLQLPHLGLRLRLVLNRPADLARVVRERRLPALRVVTIYSVALLDAFEEDKVNAIRRACVEVGVDLRIRRYEDLWDVPIVYH